MYSRGAKPRRAPRDRSRAARLRVRENADGCFIEVQVQACAGETTCDISRSGSSGAGPIARKAAGQRPGDSTATSLSSLSLYRERADSGTGAFEVENRAPRASRGELRGRGRLDAQPEQAPLGRGSQRCGVSYSVFCSSTRPCSVAPSRPRACDERREVGDAQLNLDFATRAGAAGHGGHDEYNAHALGVRLTAARRVRAAISLPRRGCASIIAFLPGVEAR